MRRNEGYGLAAKDGVVLIETVSDDKDEAWEKSFQYLCGRHDGFEEKYWKKWNESKRAAKRLGYVFRKVTVA